MLRDQFASVLKEFGSLVMEDLSLDETDNTATFTVDDDIIINLNYLNESDTILLFSPVGAFGDLNASDAGQKALALLKLNDLSGAACEVTLMLDGEGELVLAADRRSANTISSADAFAAWVEIMVRSVRATREYFAKYFPLES
ncbi:Tir chaperone protein (CesT) family protein [Succinivibrio dextrinosolvens]|uniref:type III secretion system chaperone n=1 Tax=Succinivibrio dextrinosolvens TaxID=83771 RepID=UPI0008E0F1CE|nr:type III secretion system chaperone [Succinivibrio dextrinosolvens]SFS72434.1 Tir chaperone protein (CesT) family protein [Succinivibrio dextrinosolvens]